MNAVKHFLGNYSDNFAAALVLWPVLSFMFTLPILAYLYHRDGRLRFGTFVGAYLTVLYVCGLGCFTLYPLPQGDAGLGITYGVAPNFNPMNFMNDIAKDGLKAVFQLAFNVVFFMPLGFIAGRLLRLRLLPSVLLGLAASPAHRGVPAHGPVRHLPLRLPLLRCGRRDHQHPGCCPRLGVRMAARPRSTSRAVGRCRADGASRLRAPLRGPVDRPRHRVAGGGRALRRGGRGL